MSLPRDPQKTLPLPPGPRRINVRMEAGETMSSWSARDSTHVAGDTTVQLAMACDFFSRFHDILFCGIMERCTSANLRTAPRKSLFKPPSISLERERRGGGEAGRRKRSVAQQSVRKGSSPPPKEVAKKAPFPTCKPNLHAFRGHGGKTLFQRGVMCVRYVCRRSVQAYSFAET